MNFAQNNKSSKITHSSGGVVYRLYEGLLQVLLIKPTESAQYWGIPKGRQNENESYEDTACREIYEETGVCVSLESYVGEFEVSYKTGNKIVHVFIAKPTKDDWNVTTEHPECEVFAARWFNVSELPQLQPVQEKFVLNAIKTIFKNFS